MMKTKDNSIKIPSVKKIKHCDPLCSQPKLITQVFEVDTYKIEKQQNPIEIPPLYLLSENEKPAIGNMAPLINLSFWQNSEFFKNSKVLFKRKTNKILAFIPSIFDPDFKNEIFEFSQKIQEFLEKTEVIFVFADSEFVIREFFFEKNEYFKDFAIISDLKLEAFEKYCLVDETLLQKAVFLIHGNSIITARTTNLLEILCNIS